MFEYFCFVICSFFGSNVIFVICSTYTILGALESSHLGIHRFCPQINGQYKISLLISAVGLLAQPRDSFQLNHTLLCRLVDKILVGALESSDLGIHRCALLL